MKKIILFMLFFVLWSINASADDRDCAKYTPAQASAATANGPKNKFSATFSGITTRQGTTNADCAANSPANSPANSSENAVVPPSEPEMPRPYSYQAL